MYTYILKLQLQNFDIREHTYKYIYVQTFGVKRTNIFREYF